MIFISEYMKVYLDRTSQRMILNKYCIGTFPLCEYTKTDYEPTLDVNY